MKLLAIFTVLFGALCCPAYSQTQTAQTNIPNPTPPHTTSNDPDVLLNVPNLSVQSISLSVDDLTARVNLDAKLANILSLTAGVDVGIKKVKLDIKGVKASVLLRVRLDNVAYIIDRTLTTLDRNPQIVNQLLSTVNTTVGTVGNIAAQALAPGGFLTQTVNTLGQTVTHTVDTAGNIVEKTVGSTGNAVTSKVIGNVLRLPAVGATSTDSAGNTVKTVRDTTGDLIRIVIDQAGRLLSATKG
ncbi:MAG: hypothetical protein JO018_01730 [Candidatus Eremiobacteraeota bacterium]|nr:hypothetical protein [Candidatus Eremiobacteraeota bacterium]